MASYYVRSGAGGAATGADWANAYLTLAAATSGKANGDIFYVSEDHAESTAGAVTITVVSTLATPSFIYCVNHNGSVPPVSADLRTTATVTCTGANTLTVNGNSFYCYGIIFTVGTSSTNGFALASTGNSIVRFDSCAFRLASSANQVLTWSAAGARLFLNNCTVQFGATGSSIGVVASAIIAWHNTSSAITGATLPTNLFNQNSGHGIIDVIGVDLSALGSGKTIFSDNVGFYRMLDCKLGASVTVAVTPTAGGCLCDVVRGDSGATVYREERYTYQGTQTVETTIVRTGGATDGTTPISWKLVTTANSKWFSPLISHPITIWNDSTSAITTLTIYGTTTGGGVPKDDEIWVEAEYLGSGSTPLGSFITTTKADNLAASAATNNSSDGSTWGGGGAGNGFKIVVPSFTPGMKGPINIAIKAAKASSTYYIDPRPTITNIQVSKSAVLAPGVYANELVSSPAQLINSQGLVG